MNDEYILVVTGVRSGERHERRSGWRNMVRKGEKEVRRE
jgi:hypothetical protein